MNEPTVGQFVEKVKELLEAQGLLHLTIPLDDCINELGAQKYPKYILNFRILTELMVGACLKSLERAGGISAVKLKDPDEVIATLAATSQCLLTIMSEQALSVYQIRPYNRELWNMLRDTTSRPYLNLFLAMKGAELLREMGGNNPPLIIVTEAEILAGIKLLLPSGKDEDDGSLSIAC